MALINCPECNGIVSDQAVACPHCGYPIEKKKGSTTLPNTTVDKSYFCNKKMLHEGDSVFFGKYPQGENGEINPIQWVVISLDDNNAVLICKKIIDVKAFDYLSKSSQWDTSTIRKWLNGQFLNTAFSIDEQNKIATSYVTADSNPDSPISSGKDTRDKIFLLSTKEYYDYEEEIKNIDVVRSEYCESMYPYRYGYDDIPLRCDPTEWVLRTPGKAQGTMSFVRDGFLNETHNGSQFSMFGIRPALRVNISA